MTADLIGRDAELAELETALAEARRGDGGVVLVCGDAGIGKTALVESLVAMTAPTEVHVAWGRCWGGPAAAPYWPWAQVLRAVADIASDGDLVRRLGPGASDVVQLLPELAARLPALDPTAAAEGLDARLRLFDAVAAFLRTTATETGGLVVALDDLHDADEGSLQLIRTIVHGVRRVPLLVIGTYRVDEVARLPVHQQLLGLVSDVGRTLRLRGLDEDGVGALLARTATGADVDVSRRVHDATDGNPFLVYEAARLLAHGRSDTVALPEEAHAIVRARLERLPADVRTLLAHAAVLGREFGLGTLAQLTGRPADDVLDFLAEAAAADVVEESALGQWRFVHALLQEALDDELDSARLTDLHRRAADALAPTGATARVALHLFKAGDPRAVEECAAAGRVAAVALAYEEAADWYERALAALEWSPRPDDRRRYDLLVDLGELTVKRGSIAEAREVYGRAIGVAKALGSVELAAEVAVRVAPYGRSDPVVIGALDDALCDLPDIDSALRAKVLVSFAWVLQSSSLSRSALQDVSNQGLEMARRVGDPETCWKVFLQWHSNNFAGCGDPHERLGVTAELIELAGASGSLERMALARCRRAADLFENGDVAAGRDGLAEALRLATALRQPFLVWSALVGHVGMALLEGKLDDAERLAREAVAAGERCDWVGVDMIFACQQLEIRRHQGRLDEAEELIQENLRRWPVYGIDCVNEIGLAQVYALLGRPDDARAQLDRVLGDVGVESVFSVGVHGYGRTDAVRLCCPTALAEACWLLDDDAARAPLLYDRLLPYAGRQVMAGQHGSRGACSRFLGQLATLLGRFEEAEDHFESAHRMHDSIGAPIWGAHGRADHARMLVSRGGPGDVARARELAATAGAAFRSLGLAFHAERAEALVGRAHATVRREGEYWTFEFGDDVARIRDSTGVRYLARLLRNPGQELHALDLVAGDSGCPSEGRRPEPSLFGAASSDAGAVLDSKAKAAYRRRVVDLRGELERAGTGHDAARTRAEIDFIEAQLAGAVGLGGRDRKAASDAERARQSVTRALKGTIDRLGERSRALGDHLRVTVHRRVLVLRPRPLGPGHLGRVVRCPSVHRVTDCAADRHAPGAEAKGGADVRRDRRRGRRVRFEPGHAAGPRGLAGDAAESRSGQQMDGW